MDAYAHLRSLEPLAVLSALGVDISKFKKRSNKPEWSGACPIHGSQNNKGCFSIHIDGRYSCFSCSAKGRGMIDLVSAVRSIGFKEACTFLEGIKVPEQQKNATEVVSEAVDEVLKPLEKDGWRKFAVACPWLEQRVPDAGVRERYGVFCYNNPARRSAYSGRVMIPVKDLEGQLFGYLGRAIPHASSQSHQPTSEQEPKYLFPKNLPKSRFLFGAHELAAQFPLPVKVLYLLESPFAVMKFVSLGLPAVSPFGWSTSPHQVDILCSLSRGVVYLPDTNKYHECGSTIQSLSNRLWCRSPSLPTNYTDPEALTKEQILALTK